MTELHIAAAILREAMQTVGKEEDKGLKVKMAKAEEEMRIKKVCSLCRERLTSGIQSCSRQRMRSWRIARRRCSARNEKEYSGIRRRESQLSHPRHERMSKACCFVPGGHQKATRVYMCLHSAHKQCMHCRPSHHTNE